MLGCHFSLSWYLGRGAGLEDTSPCLGGLRAHSRGGGSTVGKTGQFLVLFCFVLFFSLYYSSFMVLLGNIFFLLLFLSG
ncbi:rCG49233 [Rattus norvegicus]|uniref:RCG49233 n=1 Tax=Rattus norvegicus TaxID=10116 RepID=A6J2H7_RAT|nr:rCG49233 [Rattus norvegicus]